MNKVEGRVDMLEFRQRAAPRAGTSLRLVVLASACLALGAVMCSAFLSAHGAADKEAKRFPQGGFGDGEAFKPLTLEANRIVLRDRHGRTRIELTVGDDGPSLAMLDDKEKKRVEVKVAAGCPSVALLNAEQAELLTARVGGDRARITLGGRQGAEEKAPVSLEFVPGQRGGLYLRNDAGDTEVSLGREPGGPPMLRLNSDKSHSRTTPSGLHVLDTRGRGRAVLALLNGNFPLFELSDDEQKGPGSIRMTASSDGARRFTVHTREGKTLVELGSTGKGGSYLSLQPPDHARMLEMTVGPRDQDGPFISLTAPGGLAGGDATAARLRMGLGLDSRPYISLWDDQRKSLFHVPGRTEEKKGNP